MTDQTNVDQITVEDAAALTEDRSVGTTSRPWWALAALCLGVLMIMLDSTIVNVALPSIKQALGFSDSALAWVVNAYFLFFGGFLLLGGRLGDLYGPRRLFMIGIGVFTLASLLCGSADNAALLLVGRAAQGLGGAVVTAVALSLIMGLFRSSKDRAVAMGVYGFVCASGSTLGALLGGSLIGSFGWTSIFLVNVPVGILVIGLSLWLLAPDQAPQSKTPLDVFGALTGTVALMLAVYAIVNANVWGWLSSEFLGGIVLAVFLLVIFFVAESRMKAPLMPLSLFSIRSVAVGNVVMMFWAAALFSWFFISSLYLQLVRGYAPMDVGFGFLPANVTMAVISLGVSGLLVHKIGFRWPLAFGLGLAAGGLFLLSHVPVAGSFSADVLPGMLLFGFGAGLAVNPMFLVAIHGVPERQTGLASGVVNTSFAMGGALWLALLSSLATSQTEALQVSGVAPLEALNGGYQTALLAAAGCAAVGAIVTALFLKDGKGAAEEGRT